jgi:hypothetical protein
MALRSVRVVVKGEAKAGAKVADSGARTLSRQRSTPITME